MSAKLRAAAWHSVAIGVMGSLVAIQMRGWLDPELLPAFDFAGYVAVAQDVRDQLFAFGRVPHWNERWFAGTSQYTSHFKELLSLPLVIAFGALRGTQLAVFVLKVAAGLAVYAGFVRYLKAPGVGIAIGVAYTCSMSVNAKSLSTPMTLRATSNPGSCGKLIQDRRAVLRLAR